MTERTFHHDARFVAHARNFVAESIGPAPSAFVFDVQLMTSELASNAVLHAATEYTVSIDEWGQLITVAVTDRGDGQPTPRQPGHEIASGRGLMIIDALATAWGIDPISPPPGKRVWFSVARPGS